MSIYRTLNRTPRSDVHHVVDHVTAPARSEPEQATTAHEQHWKIRRKARPADALLPTTHRWMNALPLNAQPWALASAFPRIANMLARLWPNAAAFADYTDELLVDRRGGRKGFPVEVLADLHKLRAYHDTVNPDQLDIWEHSTLRR
jgi:hypothetical protein